MLLDGQVVVVTGATRGIGKVTASHLATTGARVAVVGRNADRGAKVVGEITAAGGDATFFACDLSVEDAVATLFDDVRDRYGKVDAVVNNAASTEIATRDRPVVDLATDDFDHFMRANVYSVFWAFKYGIPAMGLDGGAFVTMASIEAFTPRPGEPSYSTSKSAVCGLARQVAVDYGDKGIRSNTLVLGFIETNASRAFLQDDRLGGIIRGVTGGHPATSLDVARAAAFFVSEDAAGFNGATLTLDRGMTVVNHVPGDLTIEG